MKKSLLLATLSGVLLGLSFPLAVASKDIFEKLPNGILVFFAFIPLLFSLEEEKGRNSFLKGYITGIVFYTVGLFWIMYALKVFGNLSWFTSLSIFITMILYLACYTGLFGLLTRKLGSRFPVWLAASAAYASIEYLKNFVFDGFPWLNPAYALAKFNTLIQICDIAGIYTLTFFIMLVNIAIFELIKFILKKRAFPTTQISLSICLAVFFFTYGFLRLESLEKAKTKTSLNLALIQGNVPQDEKWGGDNSRDIIKKYLDLSRSAKDLNPELIVWPEGSLPFSLNLELDAIRIFPKDSFSSKFLIGSISHGRKGGERSSYNSAFYLEPDGKILSLYHKNHLVPFSEHVIYERYLPFLRKLIPPVAGDFAEGDELTIFNLRDLKFGVIICFEAIFPELSRRLVRDGADFIVNITNDAWFGKNSGPYQHFEMVKFRAIENRVSILRAANTGISAVIDPAGKISFRTKLFEDAVIKSTVEIKDLTSVYTKIGDVFVYLCLVVLHIFIGIVIFRKRKGSDQ